MRILGALALAGLLTACRSQSESGHESPSNPSSDRAASPAAAETKTKGERPQDRDQVDPDGVVRRGVEVDDRQAITVAQAAARAGESEQEMVTVTGAVGKVCSKKGCWMSVTDGEEEIRVTFKDYGFFVPEDASGLTAVVTGELKVKTLDVKTAQHFEDDRVEGTDEAPRQIDSPQREVSIVAHGLELRRG